MLPQREILWNVPPVAMTVVYLMSALSVLWIVVWFWRRSRLWARGAPPSAALPLGAGLRRLAGYLLGHGVLRRDPVTGWMHLLIFWGFVALLIATTLVGIQHHGGVVFLEGPFYLAFSLFADLGGLAFTIGVAIALVRRSRAGRLLPSAATTAVL